MANVAHNTLTGADLHEPKGVSSAAINTVYVADGVGSGAWSSGSLLVGITGQVADFATPVAPTGWLECDGTAQSRSTFATLFAALTIQQTGSRTNASAIITGLSSTTHMRSGYFIGGTGITNGTTILTVDSATQVTMSANAGSTGSATVIVSAFAQGDGTTTFTLPDTTTAGRYRRSRYPNNRMGSTQAEGTNLLSHVHTQQGSFTSGTDSVAHVHGFSGTTVGVSVTHTHGFSATVANQANVAGPGGLTVGAVVGSGTTGTESADHTHGFSGTTGIESQDHTHGVTISGNTTGPSTTNTETRPITLVLMTCIKT